MFYCMFYFTCDRSFSETSTSNIRMLTLQHVAIGVVGDGEEVRRYFIPTFSLVQENHVLVVDRQATVRVDGDTEQSGVSLRQASH